MRARLDESIPAEAVTLLADAGWDVATVHDEDMVGAEDRLVAAACQEEGRVLCSLDCARHAIVISHSTASWSPIPGLLTWGWKKCFGLDVVGPGE